MPPNPSPSPSPKALTILVETRTSLTPALERFGKVLKLPEDDTSVIELPLSPQPLTLIARGGQEIRVVAGGSTGAGWTWGGDSNNTSPSPPRH